MFAFLLVGLCALAAPALTASAERVTILCRLSLDEERALRVILDRFAASESSKPSFRVSNLGPEGAGRPPQPRFFDVLLCYPQSELAAVCLPESRRVLRVQPYGPIGKAADFDGLPFVGEGELLLPDAELEAEAGEALASLLAARGEAYIVTLVGAARDEPLRSPTIRARVAAGGLAGLVALRAGELRAGKRYPAATLGLGVSKRTAARELCARLCALLAAEADAWVLRDIGFAAGADELRGALLPEASAGERATLMRILRPASTAPPPFELLPAWLETALLVAFSLVVAVLLLRAGRRRRPARRSAT